MYYKDIVMIMVIIYYIPLNIKIVNNDVVNWQKY